MPSPTFSADMRGGEVRGEGFGHVLMHIDAVGGGAGLAQIAHLGQHRAFDGDVDDRHLRTPSAGALPPSSIAGFST